MAAPRSSSLRALRVLSQQHSTTPSIRRGLHITGAQSAQPANVSDRASLYASRTLADLKNECVKRSLRSSGSQSELVERLSNHDFLQSRAFSIAMKRINGSSSAEKNHGRQFNTSRSSKAVGDSSTVDFAYMPSMAEIDAPAARADPQIPILSDIYTHYDPTQSQEAPMRPQVYTVSGGAGDISASPMTEVVDNHSVDIDPFSLTETVGKSRFGEELKRQQNGTSEPGVVRELWSGFLEDLLGSKQQQAQKH
ncbi:altered inheritance of mitochondria protein 34, mitochondrial [Aspergillus awamori]|uniref:Contig An04c0090, genomic contig n=5 Tax=Aspergillus TaxID=5052 RepID=A5AAJ5_ASPNC|nr:uncharacterized protein An04g01430 [Aspergillus niger]XP_025451088.1 uncharacterized protein BO96DRAFT_132408 [Aspergillus niger CBS 101883]EHA20428.1 hypothetical protein ASPNIDRAFT_57089 [Aspergillus niger ATCC 1015]RDK47360.1 hypothetical protein M752DRAFT_73136 [Aspergillus phoenicis ATCC 13157]GCB23943.1 altered inheritance of mitochondria protein 34, mitochondrial [Aspergillus awamori]KAI2824559.1 hypothetical protein CBS115989_516 [Aspergillus niger]KAI2830209.1 hypothetical protein|eukprot:XP_001401509.1 SAP domain containing protein [Aspergillus niger CBS 513.88]